MSSSPPAGYLRTAEMTGELVHRFKIFGTGRPEFVRPGKTYALLASLKDCGLKIAKNAPARELVGKLLEETERRRLGDYPTATMLFMALELEGIPAREISIVEIEALLGPVATFNTNAGGST